MVTLLDSQTALDEAVKRLSQLSEIAVDTESDSFHHYKEKLCLIQLSSEIDGQVEDYIIDPLAGLNMNSLCGLFTNPSVTKVFHDVAYDLIVIRRDLGVSPQPLFDTMLALRFLGVKQFGLATVLKERYGFEANKTLQRSDWSQRPLTAAQLAYAAADTHYLLSLTHALTSELETANRRTWFDEECLRLPKRAVAQTKSEDERFWSMKGIKKFRGEELGLARALFALREERAKAIDRPPFRVFPNEALFEIAKIKPADQKQLGQMRGIGPSVVRAMGQRIIDITTQAASLPIPVREKPSVHLMAESQAREKRFEKWRDLRRKVAETLAVDPEVLLSNATLWELAEHPDDQALEHPDFSGWRKPLFAPRLVDGTMK